MSWKNILKISTEDAISDTQRFAPKLVEEGERLNQEESERTETLEWEKFKPNSLKIVNILEEWLNNNPEDAVKDRRPDMQISSEEKWRKVREKVVDFVRSKNRFYSFHQYEEYFKPVWEAFTRNHWPFKYSLKLPENKVEEIRALTPERVIWQGTWKGLQ
tara:strand:+ start:105 stop:584 length:480 start_codon:yes stop_codon:yes gene_type:complete